MLREAVAALVQHQSAGQACRMFGVSGKITTAELAQSIEVGSNYRK
jgi:hypothetical protein